MRSYDVVVVGAGPAGTSAAKAAALGNAKTLLLEKCPTVMANKPCGEATSQATFKTAGVEPKPSIVLNRAYAKVYAPNMSFVEIKDVGYLINKSLFIQEIAAQAAEAGADIHVREEALSVWRDGSVMRVKTNRDEYSAKVVIGADGYNSTVARSLGISERPEPIPTLQYVMVNCKLECTDAVRFFLGNEVAPGGYAWIFPKSEKVAEVGIGVRGAPAKIYLDRFVKMFEKELGSAKIIDFRGAPVPIGGMIKECVLDNVILVGDAAGTVIPLTGAGIHSSVAAGLAAGEVAAKACQEDDASKKRLSEFYEKYEPWIARINRSLKVMRALEKMTDEDLNMLQSILDASDIIDLANGLDVKRVAMKLLSHPIFAIKLAKAIL